MRYNTFRPLRVVAVFAAAGMLALAGCGGDSDSSTTAGSTTAGGASGAESERIADLSESGVKVAISNEPPYATLEDGEPAGIDPELARAALATQGIDKFNATVTDYDAMIPGLQAGQWDMVAAGMLVYEERCGQVLFSEPTIADVEVAVVPEGNPKGIKGYEDIAADSSVRFAVIRGTTYDTESRELGVAEDQMVAVPDTLSGVAAVRAGRADVHTLLRQSAESLRDKGSLKGLEIVPVAEAKPQVSAVAFEKDDRELRDAFNEGLEQIKADGTFDEITTKWGFDPELSKSVSLEDVGPACVD